MEYQGKADQGVQLVTVMQRYCAAGSVEASIKASVEGSIEASCLAAVKFCHPFFADSQTTLRGASEKPGGHSGKIHRHDMFLE